MDGRDSRMPGSGARAISARHGPGRAGNVLAFDDGGRRSAIALAPAHRALRPIGGAATQILRLFAGRQEKRRKTMKTIVIGLALCAAAVSQDAPKPPASVKVTRLDSP